MDDIEKTIAPRRAHESDGSENDFKTIMGARDRKADGRFQVGDLIMNRYKVISELGQGGMGVVYKCFDETAGIEVALKALPPELSHNTLEMEDIKDNFQLVAKLVHQNIAISKNLEKDDLNGNYYLIMECCEGEDLRRWIRRKRKDGNLTLDEVLPIIRQVADALDYAHKQRVMHRDIKPGNIMINNEGDIKVLDFGLAAQIHTSMTRVSMAYHGTSGTGPYMAPEQWRGRAQGAPADQYALAVMTYEMLAGHLPFESTDPAVLQQAVLTQEAEVISGLSPKVWSAINRAMSKEPAERFESCSDFALALSGKKVRAAKKNSVVFPKWLAAVIVLALLVAGGAGYYLIDKEQNGQPNIPEIAEVQLDAENSALKVELERKISDIKAKNYDPAHGFGEKIRQMEEFYLQAQESKLFRTANDNYKKSKQLADWIIANDPLRNEVREMFKLSEKKKANADKFNSSKLAADSYQKANMQVALAKVSCDDGDFKSAITALKTAISEYEKADAISRKQTLQKLLSSVRTAQRDRQWIKVKELAKEIEALDDRKAKELIAAAEKSELDDNIAEYIQQVNKAKTSKKWDTALVLINQALELDDSNPTLTALKKEITDQLKLALRIKAFVDDTEVVAKAIIGSNTFTTDQVFNNLKDYQKYKCKLSFVRGENEYYGTLDILCDWSGLQTFEVTLEDWKSAVAADKEIGIEFSSDGRTLQKYPRHLTKKEYQIPCGVKTIASRAFYNNTHLNKVVVPDSVESIEESAFGNCSSLQEINLGCGIRRIGKQAFLNCKAMNDLEIPASVVGIGVEAFMGCTGQKNAFNWFSRACHNDPSAVYNAALCCFSGNGTDIDTVRGMALLESAVNKDYFPAKLILAKSCLIGKTWIDVDDSGIPKRRHHKIDNKTALRWLNEAAANGNSDIVYELGMIYFTGAEQISPNITLAVKYLTEAAANGNVIANLQMGDFCENGTGLPKDIQKAKTYYQTAIKKGSVEGAFRFAICCEKEKSMQEALKWYLYAAQKDHVRAQYTVALFYQRGTFVSKDEEKAAEYFKKSADAGYSWGQFSYALCCEFGKGVSADLSEAARYYDLAARQNHKFAAERLQKINK